MGSVNPALRRLLKAAYEAFNARYVEAALVAIHPDVEWPNVMEGGTLRGREAVREYWTRQWQTLDPHVEPLGFDIDADGNVVVDVHQVVRDLDGNTLVDQMIQHVYTIEAGTVRRMQIREPAGQPGS